LQDLKKQFEEGNGRRLYIDKHAALWRGYFDKTATTLVLISSSGEIFWLRRHLALQSAIFRNSLVMEELQADAKRKADKAKQVPGTYHPIPKIHISSVSSDLFLPERTTYWTLRSFLD